LTEGGIEKNENKQKHKKKINKLNKKAKNSRVYKNNIINNKKKNIFFSSKFKY
jgi:hypothetical protein